MPALAVGFVFRCSTLTPGFGSASSAVTGSFAAGARGAGITAASAVGAAVASTVVSATASGAVGSSSMDCSLKRPQAFAGVASTPRSFALLLVQPILARCVADLTY
eukprot:CAMPEP_0194544422 /NCGR_PEP_ID=MMETSP0253-20130528/87535_1 /TAXON_ID=2966 /ORGANISM="Noctiluca scintillans" /LENGTH=105 /DNA_ID=CAMNT_0039391307 /DNA_START=273 /DNA_END=590 /DNA_ORIENTATION=-